MRLRGEKLQKPAAFQSLGKCFAFVDQSIFPCNVLPCDLSLHPKATLSLSGCPLSLLDHFVQAPSPDWGQVAGEKGMLEPSCIPAPQFLRKRQLWGLLWAAHS